MRFAGWALVLVAVIGTLCPATAQTGPLAPTGGPPPRDATPVVEPGSSRSLPPDTETPSSASMSIKSVERPPDVLEPPVMPAPARSIDRRYPDTGNVRVAGVEGGEVAGFSEPAPRSAPGHPGEATRRGIGLGVPESAGQPIAARSVENPPRQATSSSAPDPVDELLTTRSTGRRGGDGAPGETSASHFGERIGETLGHVFGNRGDSWFRSDHTFDNFISPVTNPFLFEDPRSLTEVRPLFLYQKIPSDQPDFRGGGVWFFGTQARVAVTDRLSFVLHKLGGISLNPGSGSIYEDSTGFAELWFGPKYTIIRGVDTGSVLAAGLQFQVPTGKASAFQSTGNGSLVPYLSYAQSFGRDLSIGSFNAMLGTGYSFAYNDRRSDYYYLSAHLDWDVFNSHRFYPLTELNWLIYTTDGHSFPSGAEGRDLFNLGGQAAGSGLLTWAFGARYKFSESAQLGAAFEIPIAGPRDLFRYRFTVDFILRY